MLENVKQWFQKLTSGENKMETFGMIAVVIGVIIGLNYLGNIISTLWFLVIPAFRTLLLLSYTPSQKIREVEENSSAGFTRTVQLNRAHREIKKIQNRANSWLAYWVFYAFDILATPLICVVKGVPIVGGVFGAVYLVFKILLIIPLNMSFNIPSYIPIIGSKREENENEGGTALIWLMNKQQSLAINYIGADKINHFNELYVEGIDEGTDIKNILIGLFKYTEDDELIKSVDLEAIKGDNLNKYVKEIKSVLMFAPLNMITGEYSEPVNKIKTIIENMSKDFSGTTVEEINNEEINNEEVTHVETKKNQ